jgi:hypothetical protein
MNADTWKIDSSYPQREALALIFSTGLKAAQMDQTFSDEDVRRFMLINMNVLQAPAEDILNEVIALKNS